MFHHEPGPPPTRTGRLGGEGGNARGLGTRRWSELFAGKPHQCGEESDGCHHSDRHGKCGGGTHDAEKRQSDDKQSQQRHDHGDAGKDDSVSGGSDRNGS